MKWKIKFNVKESNILQIRQPYVPRTNFNFKLGITMLPIVAQYKYHNIVITEFIDYNVIAQILADAPNRTLGLLQKNNGFGYYTYTKSFHNVVGTIPDYASEVRGYKKFTKIDAVQNKAIIFILGVHKFVPIVAINGDIS